MLLKKELEELSQLSGSSTGLNIIYQHKNPMNHFTRSNFELTPIVSRVDTRPSAIYSEEESEILATSGEESVFGIDSKAANGSNRSNSDSAKEDIETVVLSTGSIEQVDKQVAEEAMVEEKVGEVPIVVSKDNSKSTTDTDSEENDGDRVSSGELKQTESIGDKWKAVQDNQFLKRTASPICFFKNPGFGNRYAVNVTSKKPSPLVATLSNSNTNVKRETGNSQEVHENVSQLPSSSNCQNSTQFILSPALSQSNVSVCEAETPEQRLKRRKKKTAPLEEKSLESNPVEQMSEYNKKLRVKINDKGDTSGGGNQQPGIRLRADPAVSNFCPPRKRSGKPAVPLQTAQPPKEEVVDQAKGDCGGESQQEKFVDEKEKIETSPEVEEKEKQDEVINDIKETCKVDVTTKEVDIPEETSVIEPSIHPDNRVATRESSVVRDIPSDSWISLPVRIYTNSMQTLPWPLIGVCVLVVIIAGFLGIILSRLASSIEQRHLQESNNL